MTKKSHRWVDEYEDEYERTDKNRKKKFKERRRNKRMKNALRSKDIDDLRNLEEHDEYY